MTFEILPAIDLRGGRVVRLVRGDFARQTVYGDDPVAVARTFAEAGARWLHVVDLDGAAAGEPRQAGTVARIVDAVGEQLKVEVAGGIRDESAVEAALAGGAARVVLGTAALENPDWLAAMIGAHAPERLAVAVDVREGVAVGHGWRAGQSGLPAESVLDLLADRGAVMFEVTAIDRDGLLGGPDLELLERLVSRGRGEIVASGGIASITDLERVRAIGCRGAIVGRALYEGRLDLAEAIEAMGRRAD